VRAVLGEEAYAAAWAEGLAMPIERAVVLRTRTPPGMMVNLPCDV